ncbi:GNAT family N-acetyltransferase [Thalassotalea crassostreae]|uniref:GNAT family N-acetyltransferase n=1 Tax=Thalassotalea crassostreae TaxID=1763536 RepID=UPI000838FB3B|nr:GNAT family N-acetyltransferase [Thalassotalea crassostreae]
MTEFSIETERLLIRKLTLSDADFILQLLNEPDFHKYIGDKQVVDRESAINYIKNGPHQMFREHGFALHLVELKDSNTAIGICGLLQREGLDSADLGFAFLQKYYQQGFGFESAQAIINDHFSHVIDGALTQIDNNLDLQILAVTSLDNAASIALLEKLGFKFKTQIFLPGYKELSNLYAITADIYSI